MERRKVLGPLAGIGAAVILGGVALAAAMQSGNLGAPPPRPDPGPDRLPGMMLPGVMPPALLGHVADELGLSPEQRQTIRLLHDQAWPGFEQLRRQMQAGAELLARTAPDDPAYQSVVANVSQAAAGLAAQFVLQSSQLRSQLHGVLTQEQRAKLVALEPELHARWQERRHRDRAGSRPADRGGAVQDPR